MRMSKVSWITTIVLAIAAIGVYVAFSLISESGGSSIAIVHDGDGNQISLRLAEDQTETVSTSLGTNVLVVKDGQIHVEEADCPNHDCMKQGWIDSPGEQIVCLPHKLYVEIESPDGSSGDIDVNSR